MIEYNKNIDIENKKHIEKIYTDKVTNLLKICIGIFIFNVLTYLIGIFLYDSFDFGLIFEIISFIFVVIALNKIKQKNLQFGKRIIIIAMVPIGLLIIYDFINLLVNIDQVLIEVAGYYMSYAQYFYYLEPYLFDVTLVALIVLLYRTYSSLCKIDGTKESDNYIDTFYDKLE